MNREALRLAGVQMVKPKGESKRKIAKDYHRNIRRIDAPDEARKVAGCPKCPSWFETGEARNAHKAQEHGLSRYFVLAYKRSAGRLIEPVRETAVLSEASEQRFVWEQKYLAEGSDVEVPILIAPALADLLKTHGRYFKSAADTAAGVR